MMYVKSGKIIGTGAALPVELGFKPSRIDLMISESSIRGFYDNSMRDGTFVVEHCAELRTSEIIIGSHLPKIGTTDTSIGSTRIVSQHDGAGDVRVEVAAAAAGTAMGAGDDIAADKWGCFRMATASGGAISLTPDTGLNSATEAAAIALMGDLPANEADMGFITIKTSAGVGFNTGTDALAGGSSGAPASITNYYEGYGVMSGGITLKGEGDAYKGFEIGTSALMNVVGSEIFYKAYRE